MWFYSAEESFAKRLLHEKVGLREQGPTGIKSISKGLP